MASLATKLFACWLVAALLLCGCGKSPVPAPGGTAVSDAVLTIPTDAHSAGGLIQPLTGGRVLRVVWAQAASPQVTDLAGKSSDFFLLGLDSHDTRGIRPLCGEKRNFFRPLIMPDGDGVLFTDRNAEGGPAIFSVDWDSGAIARLTQGVALEAWRDPADAAKIWVYALEELQPSANGGLLGERVVRFHISSPNEKEIIWADGPVEASAFQLSRDGRRAAALLPAPNASRLNLDERTAKSLQNGLWPGLAPDNSYVSWVFDNATGALTFFSPTQKEPWHIFLRGSPGLSDGAHVWMPRWGNHPALFTFVGPFPHSPLDSFFKADVEVPQAEIFIGRFGAGVGELLTTVRLTQNDRADLWPDLWQEGPDMENIPGMVQTPADLAEERKPWPVAESATFAWDNLARDVTLTSPSNPADPNTSASERICRVEPKKYACFGRNLDMDVTSGYFVADAESNTAIATASAASGEFTFEALLTENRSGSEFISRRLVSYRLPDGTDMFAVYRVNNSLVLRLMLGEVGQAPQVYSQRIADYRISDGDPYHLLITFKANMLRVFTEGGEIFAQELERGGLAGWKPGELQIGDPEPYGNKLWSGTAESIAFYSQALDKAKCREAFDATKFKTTLRKSSDPVRIRAKLTHRTPVPDASTWGPYPRILVSATYDVEQVLNGTLDAKQIVVLHWAVMDRQHVPNLPEKIGQIYNIAAEPVPQHPELKSERIENASPALDAPLYLHIDPPGASYEFK